ncbi:hypothetical protein NGM36_37380 [Streptomyces mutabilis]|uniref:hypothetical protein n=1 Tax=Streptomyces mutabilis TaxID=67332 RepID=UPI0022BA4C42|nr:hypothetical protein [Streptomyces mutabilis]MCZ9355360.1 hypothetical protein [Streptomyces mutabilis]
MTNPDVRGPFPGPASAIATEAEGFLLARQHRHDAHREAQALCQALSWLTTAQAEDLTRHYIGHRLRLSRQLFEASLDRAEELRREYENRYLQLRRDLLRRYCVWASCVLACAAGVSGALCTLAR